LEALPETHLYIVGSSPPNEIRDLSRHPNITVTGYVEDIRDHYQKAQVVIVPLRTGVGIRGKILEAWSCGKAIVASSLACQGIQAIHGENVLIADKAQDFAMWTIALLSNPDFCHELGIRGRKMAENSYDWRIFGRQLIQLYRDVSGSA
jgi:glycosyltransferase involved in cell wall biosynthesis